MRLLPTRWLHPSAPQAKERMRLSSGRLLLILPLSLAVLLPFILHFPFGPSAPRYLSPVVGDGGDCEALGPLRPIWARPDEIRAALPSFARLYHRRPHRNNAGGMRFDHCFALWYTLRALDPPPRAVIESGAFNGQSTWLIREALPSATVFSLDPRPQRQNFSGVGYLTGERFQDFNTVDWKALGVDADHALVFFDDHQSGFRRVVREGMKRGFWRFIIEDNYPYPGGDNMSFKFVCEVSRKSLWPGFVQDNFGKVKTKQTWEEHLKLVEEIRHAIKTYYEFPPVATSKISGQTRFDEAYASKPLLNDAKEFERISKGLDSAEFHAYTHFAYIETTRGLVKDASSFV